MEGVVKRNQAQAKGGDKKKDNDDTGNRDEMVQGEGAGLDGTEQGSRSKAGAARAPTRRTRARGGTS